KRQTALEQSPPVVRPLKKPPARTDDPYGVLAEAANDFIFVIDNHDRVVYVNRFAADQLGLPVKKIIGKPRNGLFPPRVAESQGKNLEKVFRTGHPLNVENIILFGSREVWINTWLVPFQQEKNRVQSVLGISRDITERKKVEEELRNSQKELRALSARLQSVREEERGKIAREIHDDLGQALTGLKMDSAWVMKNLRPDQTALKDKLQAMGRLIDHTVRSVRRLSTELRPRILDDFGLVAALEWQAQEFEKKTGIRCRFRSSLQKLDLDPDRSVAVFRIFQEALTNVARHSGAQKVESTLSKEKKGLRLILRDNGRGISEEEISRTKSLGLVGMRERAILFGGKLTIQGTPGKGTAVILNIPA
ncbi:MAG TPA: PAS domain-containing protein, partial [Thermodesulfobacteriota bacterium]|nr:PAS domain-containing protein [Thermodesulfobacteriota bacterium]